MKVNLAFVPPNGGETDYSLTMELPEIPKKGDYVSIFRDKNFGTEDFIVKRTWWQLSYKNSENIGTLKDIWVECEFAENVFSSDSHKNTCSTYKEKTGVLNKFDTSVY
jgi:hypothetical protein